MSRFMSTADRSPCPTAISRGWCTKPKLRFRSAPRAICAPRLWTAELLTGRRPFERLLIATDTPTGSGIMPLGMLYTISHLASLDEIPVEWAIAAATGNNARRLSAEQRLSQAGRDADIVVIDACAGGSQNDALDALRNGDIAAVGAVISDGVPRFVGRSRNTPGPIRNVRVADCKLPRDFSGNPH